MCFSGKYTQNEILRKLAGKGGLTALLGSNDLRELEAKAKAGDEKVKSVLQAMSYTIGKEIGAMLAALHGEVDGVILTGGVAFCDCVVEYIEDMIKPLAPVFVYPGEDELGALAGNAVRVLQGEKAKEFV